jgi:hypothetical protein
MNSQSLSVTGSRSAIMECGTSPARWPDVDGSASVAGRHAARAADPGPGAWLELDRAARPAHHDELLPEREPVDKCPSVIATIEAR